MQWGNSREMDPGMVRGNRAGERGETNVKRYGGSEKRTKETRKNSRERSEVEGNSVQTRHNRTETSTRRVESEQERGAAGARGGAQLD